MADEHRRIEPRMPVAGTGMATDPERIEMLQHDYERRVRSSTPKDGPGFGAVLADAPAFDPDDPNPQADDDDNEDAEAEDIAVSTAASPNDDRAKADNSDDNGAEKKLPRTPPDPRMLALNRRFDVQDSKQDNSQLDKRRSAVKKSSRKAVVPEPIETPARVTSVAKAEVSTSNSRLKNDVKSRPKTTGRTKRLGRSSPKVTK